MGTDLGEFGVVVGRVESNFDRNTCTEAFGPWIFIMKPEQGAILNVVCTDFEISCWRGSFTSQDLANKVATSIFLLISSPGNCC